MAREVICDFEGRRRPVSFYCSQLDSTKEAHDNLLSAVKTEFSDIISWKEKDSYFLQEEHGMIDVCSEKIKPCFCVFFRLTRKNRRIGLLGAS